MKRLLACAALPLLACSAGDAPLEVVARLGPGVGTPEPAELRLGRETRPAVCADPGAPLRLDLPARARRLLVSTGSEAAGPDERARVVDDSDAEERVLLDAPAVEPARWHDHVVELPARAASHRLELRGSGGRRRCWGVVALGPPVAEAGSPPNLIVVSLDTLGARSLSAFGAPEGASPRIDAFLEEAFSFERAFVQYPGTLVSHSTLFTGLYPVSHGRYDQSFELRRSLVPAIAAAGYTTAAFTEDAYVGSTFGFAVGFDRWDDGEGRGFEAVSGNAPTTFANASRWLEQVGRGARFFLFVHTYEVHSPYVPPEAHLGLANRITPGDERRFPPRELAATIRHHNDGSRPLPERDLRRLEALHLAEVQHLDAVVGAFLDRLDALGLADDTIVVLTSDHGELFGEDGKLGHGQSLHNRLIQVPLAIRWPGVVRSGRYAAPAQSVDLMPTLFGLAGLPTPEGRDGRSFAAFLRGEAEAPPARPAFAELHRDRGSCAHWPGPGRCWLGRFSVQDERMKYVSSEFPPFERLYDLAEDPAESRDLASERPAELARYRALVEGYRSAAARRVPAIDVDALDAETRERLEVLGYIDD